MLGTSFGLAITTIAQSAGMNAEAGRMGISIPADATALQIPPQVLLKGYRSAQWASFAFGLCGECFDKLLICSRADELIGLVLVVVFLHGIGIVGSKRSKAVTAPEEAQPVTEEKEKEKEAEKVNNESKEAISRT